jgi:hypothetical protein
MLVGLAFLATHNRHSGLTSLGFFGMAAPGFGLFGAAGCVVGTVETATAARRQRRAMERVGGRRLASSGEPFEPPFNGRCRCRRGPGPHHSGPPGVGLSETSHSR